MRDLNRITFDPEVMQGQACIRGMRIPVSLVVNLLAHGKSKNDILAEYPALEPKDISQSLEYAAQLSRETTTKGKVVSPVDRHIEIRSGYSGGEPHIKGRRIKVRHVVFWYKRMGMSPDKIASEFRLDLADIHAALAYYFDHREAIDQDIRDDDAFNEALEKASSQEEKMKVVASYEWPDRYGSTQTRTSQGP